MWSALTSSSNFVLESLETFVESTGIAGLLANMGWGSLVMICVAFFLLYLAIKHKFEPLLLLTIAFGMLLTNLPGANLYHTELFAGGHVHWDIFVANAGLLDYLYLGVKLGIYPCLIFVGVGAMTDFGPLIANPKSFLLGAAAQIGIFLTFIGAYALGFSPSEAGSIGIIGGADGPTSIYLTAILAPELLGPIAVAAYSYMALVPVIQPPIMRMLTTEKERKIKMRQLRPVSKTEKILFPLIITVIIALLLPSAAPLVGCLMLGNLMKECGVVDRLSKTVQNELMNIVVIFLGLTVGATATAEAFLNPRTLFILLLGVVWWLNRKDRLADKRWLLWVAVWTVPLAYLASQAGWIVAEVGRQPWAIQDLMPVGVAASKIPSGSVSVTFFLFLALFTALLVAELSIMFRQIKIGPKND